MKCSEVTRYLSESGQPESGGLSTFSGECEQHLKRCSCCSALAQLSAGAATSEPVSAATLQRIQAEILADLKPVQPLLPRGLFLIAFLLVFAVFAAIGVYRLAPLGWEDMTAGQKAGVFASLACSAGLLGMSLVLQMVPGSRFRVPPALVFPAVLVFLLLVMARAFQFAAEPTFLAAGAWCLRAGTPYIVPAGIAFWLLLRRGTAVSPWLTGMTAGALAGLVGMTVLQVHCVNFDVLHIVTFHLGVVVIGAVAGLIFSLAGKLLTRCFAAGVQHAAR